jgi:hypothetical protein
MTDPRDTSQANPDRCPVCERKGGKHFPACPHERPRGHYSVAVTLTLPGGRQVRALHDGIDGPGDLSGETIAHLLNEAIGGAARAVRAKLSPPSPVKLSLEGAQLVERRRDTGAVVARHVIPGTIRTLSIRGTIREGCKTCGGTGKLGDDRCPTCGGEG